MTFSVIFTKASSITLWQSGIHICIYESIYSETPQLELCLNVYISSLCGGEYLACLHRPYSIVIM